MFHTFKRKAGKNNQKTNGLWIILVSLRPHPKIKFYQMKKQRIKSCMVAAYTA